MTTPYAYPLSSQKDISVLGPLPRHIRDALTSTLILQPHVDNLQAQPPSQIFPYALREDSRLETSTLLVDPAPRSNAAHVWKALTGALPHFFKEPKYSWFDLRDLIPEDAFVSDLDAVDFPTLLKVGGFGLFEQMWARPGLRFSIADSFPHVPMLIDPEMPQTAQAALAARWMGFGLETSDFLHRKAPDLKRAGFEVRLVEPVYLEGELNLPKGDPPEDSASKMRRARFHKVMARHLAEFHSRSAEGGLALLQRTLIMIGPFVFGAAQSASHRKERVWTKMCGFRALDALCGSSMPWVKEALNEISTPDDFAHLILEHTLPAEGVNPSALSATW